MMVEDFREELYSLDNNYWYESVSNILSLLNYPVNLECVDDVEDFIHMRVNRTYKLNKRDLINLHSCMQIAVFYSSKRYRRLRVFGIRLTGTRDEKDEKVEYLSVLFRKIYGPLIVLVCVFEDTLAFSGLSYRERNRSEVIISDWYSYETDDETFEGLLEKDFSLFSGKTYGQLYQDYLWAISRPYMKYSESKTYLIYGCGNPVIKEKSYEERDGLTTKIDREETYRINASYYPEKYGADYYIDQTNAKVDDYKFEYIDEEQLQMEWTLLEMELDKDVEDDSDNEEESDSLPREEFGKRDDDDSREYEGMNPEEMLRYIRKQ